MIARGRPQDAGKERGSVLLVVSLMILMLGALSFAFLQNGLAEKTMVEQRGSMLHALEIAEKGVVQACLEIRCGVDADGDGLGTVHGEFANGDYEVAAQRDATFPDRWALSAVGTHRLATRRIEVGVRLRAGGDFVEGLFAKDTLTFNGRTQTDAYDSRTGTYASQATNSDGAGTYAEGGGHIGSNTGIVLNGASVTVRGNAIPGPMHTTRMSGNPTVWGDVLPRRRTIDLPAPTLAEFQTILAVNDNAQLLPAGNGQGGGGNPDGGNPRGGGGNSPYNPNTYALTANGQTDVTLPAGTYLFSDVRLTGQAKLVVTGDTTVYVTGDFDVSGGGFVNRTGRPSSLHVIAHPYWVIPNHRPTSSRVKIRGGSDAAMALYGPGADLSVHGDDDIYGAFVAKTITIAGNSRFHYDRALGESDHYGEALLERLYWRDLDERIR